jgi:hypothetical protein
MDHGCFNALKAPSRKVVTLVKDRMSLKTIRVPQAKWSLSALPFSYKKMAKQRKSRWNILPVQVRPWHLVATALILPKYDSS